MCDRPRRGTAQRARSRARCGDAARRVRPAAGLRGRRAGRVAARSRLARTVLDAPRRGRPRHAAGWSWATAWRRSCWRRIARSPRMCWCWTARTGERRLPTNAARRCAGRGGARRRSRRPDFGPDCLTPLPVAALPGWDAERLGRLPFDDLSVFRPPCYADIHACPVPGRRPGSDRHRLRRATSNTAPRARLTSSARLPCSCSRPDPGCCCSSWPCCPRSRVTLAAIAVVLLVLDLYAYFVVFVATAKREFRGHLSVQADLRTCTRGSGGTCRLSRCSRQRARGLNMRAAIVTGVSRGLGEALAHALLERGYVVLGVGRASGARLAGPNYRFVEFDLAEPARVDNVLAASFAQLAARAPITCASSTTPPSARLWASSEDSDAEEIARTACREPGGACRAVPISFAGYSRTTPPSAGSSTCLRAPPAMRCRPCPATALPRREWKC